MVKSHHKVTLHESFHGHFASLVVLGHSIVVDAPA